MKQTITELKNLITAMINDDNLDTQCIFDFQNYDNEIIELKNFFKENNIKNIEISSNFGTGIAIRKIKF